MRLRVARRPHSARPSGESDWPARPRHESHADPTRLARVVNQTGRLKARRVTRRPALIPRVVYKAAPGQAAFAFRFSWFGWPAKSSVERQPYKLLSSIKSLGEGDCLRPLESTWTSDVVKLFCSTTESVLPVFLATRVACKPVILIHHSARELSR